MEIKELDKNLIEMANSRSFNGNRGKIREETYKAYVEEIMNWKIGDNKKQKILDKLYEKQAEILRYEAQFVSIMVAGPARYNAKKYDKGDKILELCHYMSEWFKNLEKQIEISVKNKEDKTEELITYIKRIYELNLNPTQDIMKLAYVNNQMFIKIYDEYYPNFKWRKNSNIYKLYQKSLNGEIKETKKYEFFSLGNPLDFNIFKHNYII